MGPLQGANLQGAHQIGAFIIYSTLMLRLKSG